MTSTSQPSFLANGQANVDSKDNEGLTALHRAAAHGRADLARLLLDFQAALLCGRKDCSVQAFHPKLLLSISRGQNPRTLPPEP